MQPATAETVASGNCEVGRALDWPNSQYAETITLPGQSLSPAGAWAGRAAHDREQETCERHVDVLAHDGRLRAAAGGVIVSNRNYTFDILKSTKECVINIPTAMLAK
jgi:hypothetical protein